eukprot:COSAG02_NODE_3075_length_7421_cov_1.971592_3_plen_52_part_00
MVGPTIVYIYFASPLQGQRQDPSICAFWGLGYPRMNQLLHAPALEMCSPNS